MLAAYARSPVGSALPSECTNASRSSYASTSSSLSTVKLQQRARHC